jgi:hypothetical protein
VTESLALRRADDSISRRAASICCLVLTKASATAPRTSQSRSIRSSSRYAISARMANARPNYNFAQGRFKPSAIRRRSLFHRSEEFVVLGDRSPRFGELSIEPSFLIVSRLVGPQLAPGRLVLCLFESVRHNSQHALEGPNDL